ncbi:MAG: YbjN domain-containing protein [Hyphomicrobiales bacterium]
MTAIDYRDLKRHEHPLDIVERLASSQDRPFDRLGDDEITLMVPGAWGVYHVAFNWLDTMEALHLACAIDIKVPDRRRSEINELVSRINEQLWIGHFDLWTDDNSVLFRHSLILSGGADPTGQQCEALLDIAVESCNRHYQAFQFVLWAGKSPAEALAASMFETAGEA